MVEHSGELAHTCSLCGELTELIGNMCVLCSYMDRTRAYHELSMKDVFQVYDGNHGCTIPSCGLCSKRVINKTVIVVYGCILHTVDVELEHKIQAGWQTHRTRKFLKGVFSR